MRTVNLGLVLGSSLLLFSFLHPTHGTLMLGTMMLAAKTGLMLGNLGVGGMLMMLLAASQQTHEGGTGTYGKKRSVRSVGDKVAEAEDAKVNATEEIILTERMIRQIDATFDSFTCLPKFVCGMNAQPPSKKTSLVNDYGHLLKLMFSPDDEDSDEEGSPSKKGKQGMGTPTKDGENVEDLVNEELLDEDPELLPFILKDMSKRKNSNRHDEDADESPDEMPFYPRPPPPRSPLSSFASYLPKIEAGLGTKSSDSEFDNDPFFAGFRSLKSIPGKDEEGEHKPLPILEILEDSTTEAMTRKERMGFIRRKSKELEFSKDVLKKYRIAAEVGRKLKNKQDCSKVFKKCPYEWDEVTGVVSNIRKAITNHPMVTGKDPANEKVIYLKTTSGTGGNQSLLNVAAAAGGASGDGATTLLHELGNGNLMEISMKLVPMVEANTPPTVENLGMKLKRPKPNKSQPVTTYSETRFPTRDPPQLTEADIDASALAFQKKNTNRTRTKPKKVKSRPGPVHIPVLKEELATLPTPPVGEDDEFEDALPIFVNQKEKPVEEDQDDEAGEEEKPDGDDEAEDEDGDEEDVDDDDDEDEEEFGEEGKTGGSVAVTRRKSQFMNSRIPPFPLMQRGGAGSYLMPRPGQERFTRKDDDARPEPNAPAAFSSSGQEPLRPL